jgi:hypothetical protein
MTPPPPSPLPPHRAPTSSSTAYGLTALDDEARAVATARQGERNSTLNRAAFRLGQLAATGALTRQIISDRLHSAAAECGLPNKEAHRTITSELRAGLRTPRHPTTPHAAIELHGP